MILIISTKICKIVFAACDLEFSSWVWRDMQQCGHHVHSAMLAATVLSMLLLGARAEGPESGVILPSVEWVDVDGARV
jgi:hypothetical protein